MGLGAPGRSSQGKAAYDSSACSSLLCGQGVIQKGFYDCQLKRCQIQ